MNFGDYGDHSVHLAVDLVNTALQAPDGLRTAADLDGFMAAHEPGEWGPFAEGDVREVRALRARLQGVLGAPDTDSAVDRLNALLAHTSPRPYVSNHDGAPWHLHVVPPEVSVAHYLGAVTAMALAGIVVEQGGLQRFGRCASETCDDVFVDTSKNRSRRYCSDGCANVSNVRKFRARSRAES